MRTVIFTFVFILTILGLSSFAHAMSSESMDRLNAAQASAAKELKVLQKEYRAEINDRLARRVELTPNPIRPITKVAYAKTRE
jgi:hypothetical protein